jgi:hypothetical protein
MKDGGPAFPTHVYDPRIEPDPRFSIATIQGMTMRDWFAGMAMQGYISAGVPSEVTYRDMAEKFYKAADAMLEERYRSDP